MIDTSQKPKGSFFCRLRREITLEGSNLRDPLSGTTYPLDSLQLQLSTVLKTGISLEEVLAKPFVPLEASGSRIERELRQFALLGFLEGTCDQSRRALEAVQSGQTVSTRVLEGSRFGCHNSGACCRGYIFGAIREEEKLRIEALDVLPALPHLAGKILFNEVGLSSGKRTYTLGTIGEVCVFLEEGAQCGLHRAFGPSAKPSLCQLFPLAAVLTIDGLKIYDRGECASFALSAKSGSFLDEDTHRIRSLVDETLYHPIVLLHRSWRCDYGLVLSLTKRLDDETSAQSTVTALHDIGHIVRGFIIALSKCPIGPGQPAECVAETLRRPTKDFRPSASQIAVNASAGLRALALISEGLAERVSRSDPLGQAFAESAIFLAEICRNVLGAISPPNREQQILAIPLGLDCDRAMQLSLRQQLFGRELLLDDQLPAGLLRIVFVVLLTLAGAHLRAHGECTSKVSPWQFSFVHMAVKRMLHHPEPHKLLVVNGEQVWPILDALPLLARDCDTNSPQGWLPNY